MYLGILLALSLVFYGFANWRLLLALGTGLVCGGAALASTRSAVDFYRRDPSP